MQLLPFRLFAYLRFLSAALRFIPQRQRGEPRQTFEYRDADIWHEG